MTMLTSEQGWTVSRVMRHSKLCEMCCRIVRPLPSVANVDSVAVENDV